MRRNHTNIEEVLKGVRHVIDLDLRDTYEESDIHPGAVLVCFNGCTEVVAVVDSSGAGERIEKDDAKDAARDYMEDQHGTSSDPTYAYLLGKGDVDWLSEDEIDEIKSDIERAMNEMANQRAAETHSTWFDDDSSTLEDLGYDVEGEPWKIAEFGYETGVDGDLLVSPHWYDVLNLEKGRGVESWREAKVKGGAPNAITAFYDWLRREGYEYVERMSGRIPGGDEEELAVEHIVDNVARSLSVSEEQVERVLEDEYQPRSGMLYWQSDSGDSEVWAKRKKRVYLVIEFVHTDSDDYGHRYGAVVSADTQSEAEEAFANAVESGDETFWSQEAIDSGDTPERLERYGAPLEQQGWYMSWQDYEGTLSEEELEEAQETGEWPEIESSTEVIQVQSVKVLDDPDSAEVSAEHLKVVWEHDVED